MSNKNLDQFMEKILVFVDRNGSITSKESNLMACSLNMKYDVGDLKIKMHAYSHCMGNGSCSAEVKFKNKLVFKAGGGFTSTCSNVKAKTYEPGEWEKLIK